MLLDIFYLAAGLLLSPWLIYRAAKTGRYRHGLAGKLLGARDVACADGRPVVWFHGVSVGEIHLLRQVVAAFRQRYPDWQCVISTTTDTGYDEACKHFADLRVIFWPFDFTWAVQPGAAARPADAGRAGRRRDVAELSLRRPEARRSRRGHQRPHEPAQCRALSASSAGCLRRLRQARLDRALQTEEYAASYRTSRRVAQRVIVTGNVKYDGVTADRDNPQDAGNCAGCFGIAGRSRLGRRQHAGSGGSDRPRHLSPGSSERHPNLRLILVPRQPERFDEVARLLERVRRASDAVRRRRSAFDRRAGDRTVRTLAIVLVDTIGELSAIWGLADVAFVGGSLDGKRGGQNMIEPAAYGAAVLFGPHTWNFKQTVADLLARDAAIQVRRRARRWSGGGAAARRRGSCGSGSAQAARQFVLSQQGATGRTLDGSASVDGCGG